MLESVTTNSLTWDDLNYDSGIVKNIHYGLIHKGFTETCISDKNPLIPWINGEKALKNYTLVGLGDLILADASEDRKDVGKPIEIIDTHCVTVSGLHTIHAKDKTDYFIPGYKGFYFQSSSMKNQIYKIANGSKIYGISPNAFNELYISIPNKNEQAKIVDLLIKIEERISTQNKIIEDLVYQKNQIRKKIVNKLLIKSEVRLCNLCSIVTGKKDANQMRENGQYKFFTCSKDDYYIDTYSFEGESLIISGNGEIGLIKFYSGKFDAYQRTYVLQNFLCDPIFLKSVLEEKLPRVVNKEKNIGAMPYITIGTLNNILIPLPNDNAQLKVKEIIQKLELRIKNESQILIDFEIQKKYLLNNLFI